MSRLVVRTMLSLGALAFALVVPSTQLRLIAQEPTTAPEASSEKSEHGDAAKHGGGKHHDETDVGHANATKLLEAPEEFKYDLAIYTFVVFMLLVLVLLKFAWKPIMQGLEKREQSIATMIAEARDSAQKAELALQQYQARIAAAQEETREMMIRSRQEAEALKEKILVEAQAAAQRERDQAIGDIRTAKNLALQEIAQTSVNTAVGLASRIVQREIKPQDHAALIREALEKLPSNN